MFNNLNINNLNIEVDKPLQIGTYNGKKLYLLAEKFTVTPTTTGATVLKKNDTNWDYSKLIHLAYSIKAPTIPEFSTTVGTIYYKEKHFNMWISSSTYVGKQLDVFTYTFYME